MVITIASGKGGAGKTSVTVNLAKTAALSGYDVQVMDTDVEAPNAHLFLKPTIETETAVNSLVPEVDENLCTLCGACADVCEYHAIGVFGTSIMVFPELCHSCGACVLACPEKAITEVEYRIGALRRGWAGDSIEFIDGRLKIGEAKAPPVIRKVKKHLNREKMTFIDAPPGNSCPVVEAIKSSDFILLVTEPTPFGFHDLRMTFDVVRELDIPFGLVINKAGLGNRDVYDFCETHNIPVLLEIPFRRDLAKTYAAGQTWVELFTDIREDFSRLLQSLMERGRSK